MSNTVVPYPDQLTPAYWDKKKGALPTGHSLPDALKALQRKHSAVDWAPYEPGWSRASKTADELQQAFAQRDRTYRSSALPLKREAADVASTAQKLAKDKASGKPTVDAAKAIAEAAGKLSDAIDDGADALKKEFDQAQGSLPGDDEADEPGSVLLDPKNLLAQLNLCKRTPDKRMQFAYTDAHDKQAAVLSLHPRMAGKKMFGKLQTETKVKTGAFGVAWVADDQLILQLEKPLSGLVKKVRAPLKAAGFKVAKVVLWNPDGTVFEQDDEDASADAGGPAAAAAAAAPETQGGQTTPQRVADADADAATDADAGDAEGPDPDAVPVDDARLAAYEQRRSAMWPAVLAALREGPDDRASKLRAVLGFADGKTEAGQYDAGMKGLDAVQGLLKPAAPSAPPAAGPAAPAAAAPAAPVRMPMKVSARIAFTQSRLQWEQTRLELRKELQQLEAKVLEECRNEPDFAEIQSNSGVLYSVLDHLDERLIDKLDEALNAADPAQRAAHSRDALKIVEDYIQFTRTDQLLADIAANGFLATNTPALLGQRLGAMAEQLRAAL